MKKLSLLVSAFTLLLFVSCKEEAKEEPMNEVATEQTPSDSTAAATEESTKIKVSSDGVEYSDGNTEVEVSTDGAEAKKK